MIGGLVTLLIVVAILGGLYLGSRQVYFLGTDDAGLVTMYRGLPYELPLGIDLYSRGVRERRARARHPGRRGASACSTTSGAAATTPATWCASSSAATSRERASGDGLARLRELFALIPVTAIVSAGFLAVLITAHQGRQRPRR